MNADLRRIVDTLNDYTEKTSDCGLVTQLERNYKRIAEKTHRKTPPFPITPYSPACRARHAYSPKAGANPLRASPFWNTIEMLDASISAVGFEPTPRKRRSRRTSDSTNPRPLPRERGRSRGALSTEHHEPGLFTSPPFRRSVRNGSKRERIRARSASEGSGTIYPRLRFGLVSNSG